MSTANLLIDRPPADDPRADNLPLRLLAFAAAVLLAYQALHFMWRDPRHYIIDYTQKSFGDYWPNRGWLLFHIAGAITALVTGPFQLWMGLRRKYLSVHRKLGLVYLAGVVIGGIGAFRLAVVSTAADRGVSVFVFAATWWIMIAMAYAAIRRHHIDVHRQWMIRGYVLTYSFVTIRWISDFPVFNTMGPAGIPTTNWLGWVVPLVITEVALQWRKTIG